MLRGLLPCQLLLLHQRLLLQQLPQAAAGWTPWGATAASCRRCLPLQQQALLRLLLQLLLLQLLLPLLRLQHLQLAEL